MTDDTTKAKPGDLKDNPYAGDLYARGYAFVASKTAKAPPHWKKTEFCEYSVLHDPRLDVLHEDHESAELMVLGFFCDVRFPKMSTFELVNRLAKTLVEDEEQFLNELDYTCGRYVMAYRRGANYWLLNDATGMRTAFYYLGEERVVGSHVRLVAQIAPDAPEGPPVQMKFDFPGLRTPFKNVRQLTPNTRLNLRTFEIDRYWPRAPIEETEVDPAVDRMSDWMNAAFTHFTTFYRPVMSVTAGLDSRVTMSLSRDIPNVDCFSYYRSDTVDTDKLDREFAQEFQKISGKKVEILDMRAMAPTDPRFLEIQQQNTIFNHIKRVAWIYHQKYAADPTVMHIRSNVSEVGREFYRGKTFEVRRSRDLARIYLAGEKEYKSRYVFDVIDRFEEYDDVTGILACKDMVDIKSLFYWEFRMGSWHSGVVLESDPAFETISLYNCRKILETMLSVPKVYRLRSSLLRRVIAKNWPLLSKYPVNGKPFWPQ